MSTSATYSGTTTRAGRSGRGLGIAAAALAVVIAGGVVFAVNQANDAPLSNVDARLSEPAFQAESDRLTAMAEHWIRTDPENYPSELKRIYEMIAQANAKSHPAFNIEKTKMALAGEAGPAAETSGAVEQRLAHEFLEDQRTPTPPATVNPMEGFAE